MREGLTGFAILVALQLAGEGLVRALAIPFPGAVAGMLMLLALLALFGERLLARVAKAADLLLRNLTLLFFAPVVALLLDRSVFSAWLAPLAVAVFIATPVTMLLVAVILKAAVPPEDAA